MPRISISPWCVNNTKNIDKVRFHKIDWTRIDGLVQDCSNSIANAME